MNERVFHQMGVRVLETFCMGSQKDQATEKGLEGGPLPAEPCLTSYARIGSCDTRGPMRPEEPPMVESS